MKYFFRSFPAWLALSILGSLFVLPAGAQARTASLASPAETPATTMAHYPWEFGPFMQGGVGTENRSDYHFTAAGVKFGKVVLGPALPGLLRGRFEYDVEFMPYWQAFTPKGGMRLAPVRQADGHYTNELLPHGGGTFTGLSITPIILRWDFVPRGHWAPFVQGGGGMIYTTHKFPPDVLVPHGTMGGTSVWNFTPQFGVGVNYFISPRRSIYFEANAIHISSSSLGDKNPGVNASVQFQLGYSWWWNHKH